MKRNHQLARRTGALVLALTLALTTLAAAAEPKSRTEARQEDLNFLYDTLKSRHPDLFANTPEAVFLERKAEIEQRLAEESEANFVLDLQSLVALTGDSHTSASFGIVGKTARYYPLDFSWMDGKWYLSAAETEHGALLGAEVTAVNGHGMDEVLEAFGTLFSADNPVKLRRQYDQANNVAELYEYVGVIAGGAPMTLTLTGKAGGGELTVDAVDRQTLSGMELSTLTERRARSAPTDTENKYYLAKALNAGAYYIQYNVCMEDPELPMETFAAQVETALAGGNYSRVIVDLRSNGGGSDGVIWPLLHVLRQAMDGGAEVVGLIGETTFSSAIINAVELQEMGAVLVGEPTSGSVDHFGAVGRFALPNSGVEVGYSTKYIDLATLLDAAAGKGVEPLVPDVAASQTLADFLAGKDTPVEYLLSHPQRLAQAERPDAPLTRGRFLGQLYGAAGSPAAGEPDFPDLLESIEWYVPALGWGQEQGIAQGMKNGGFAAARELTWKEAAAFLIRTAAALKLEPAQTRTAPLPAGLAGVSGDRTALETAWRWGLLPADADFTAAPTRAQGLAMAAALVR